MLSVGGAEGPLWEGPRCRCGRGREAAYLVELLVVGDGQQDVSRRDSALLVVSGCVTRQL